LKRMHGLRHAYAQLRYEALTGWKPPAAGGPSTQSLTVSQRLADFEARLIISRELGHERIEITKVYLGSSRNLLSVGVLVLTLSTTLPIAPGHKRFARGGCVDACSSVAERVHGGADLMRTKEQEVWRCRSVSLRLTQIKSPARGRAQFVALPSESSLVLRFVAGFQNVDDPDDEALLGLR
jgi:hypothetical protein